MKNKCTLALFCIVLFIIGSIHADVKDGEYPVQVCLLKAYEDDYSMGNNAMLSDATLYVNDGVGRLRVNFVPLEARGFRGYLGALWVNGVPASVLATYDEVDSYNDSENGIDEKMKGQKYPRVLEFNIDLNSDIQPCKVYVPVMAEMGVGEQNARIKITYPEGFNTDTASTQEDDESINDNTKADVDLAENEVKKQEALTNTQDESKDDVNEEKYYTVPIKLWHAVEDRESMGNGSMTNEANIYLKDGKMTLYIGSNTMTVSTITASLINLYYDNGTEFVKATPHSFNMKIDGFDELRPEVFTMPLNSKNEYLFVMVDPKVEPMGDDPIKARFKFDFANMKEVKKEEAKLIQMAKNGKPKPAYDANKECTKMDKGIRIEVPKNTFDTDYTFYANQIRGEELNQYKKNFDSLAIIKAYKLSALGELDKISYDAKRPINNLRESFQPKNSIKITLPIEQNASDVKLYAMDKNNKIEVAFQQNQDSISFEYDKFVPFIVVYKKDMAQKNVSTTTEKNKLDSNVDNEYKNSVKDLMRNGAKPKTYENKLFIVFYIILLIVLSSISIYIIRKYSKKLKNELYYAEFLNLKLTQKHLSQENEMDDEEELK